MEKRQTVLLTGAAGSMGFETFLELRKRASIEIVLLLRRSKKNIRKFTPYCPTIAPDEPISQSGRLKIVWGDATRYEDIALAVRGVDVVLNCMGVIPPQADLHPEMAENVNVRAVEYLIRAIKSEPDGAERIKFVNIGSVAQYGDRMGRIHFGRVGDPMIINPFDFYGLTKYRAERLVVESGLKHWVQIRQTFILIPDLFSLKAPIMFHQPLACSLECITRRDAGFGMANILDIPDDSEFWCNVYNMGGGERLRTDYLSFLRTMFGMMGMRVEKIIEPSWFALRNFHVMYFADTERLNNYLHHQRDTMEDFLAWVWREMPWYLKGVAKANKILPPLRWLVEKITRKELKTMALEKSGTLSWLKNRNDLRVKAYWGSYEQQRAISGWEGRMETREAETITLSHGYDEQKNALEISDLRAAAQFRGWTLLSEQWSGDLYEPLQWQCSFRHRFSASAFAVLKAGHGCPECEPPDWNWDEVAANNPFVAQVWHETHAPSERNYYPKTSLRDIL